MDEQAVKRPLPGFVGVESLVKKMAQKPPALRDAERVDARHRRDARFVFLEIGREVARRHEAEAGDDGILCPVDHFVDLPRLEASREMDKPRVGHRLAIHDAGKLPVLARDQPAAGQRRLAHGQHVGRIVGIGHRILGAADGAGDDVRQWMLFHLLGHHEIRAHQARDGRAIRRAGDRRVEPQGAGILRRVKLPADPDQGHPAAQQKLVAEFLRRRRVRCSLGALKQAHDAFAAAIRDFHQRSAAAARRIFRPQDVNVGGKLDFSGSVARRLVEVHHGAVVVVLRVHFEVDRADQFLVGPGFAKRLAAEDVAPRLDLHPVHAGLTRRHAAPQEQEKPKETQGRGEERGAVHGFRGMMLAKNYNRPAASRHGGFRDSRVALAAAKPDCPA